MSEGVSDGTMTDWRAEFERTSSAPASRVDERIWREVFGDEYPEGVDPYSFLSASELRRFAADLGLQAGETLLEEMNATNATMIRRFFMVAVAH